MDSDSEYSEYADHYQEDHDDPQDLQGQYNESSIIDFQMGDYYMDISWAKEPIIIEETRKIIARLTEKLIKELSEINWKLTAKSNFEQTKKQNNTIKLKEYNTRSKLSKFKENFNQTKNLKKNLLRLVMKSFKREKKVDENVNEVNNKPSSPFNVHIDYVEVDEESKDNLNDYSLGFNSVISGNTTRRMFTSRLSVIDTEESKGKEDNNNIKKKSKFNTKKEIKEENSMSNPSSSSSGDEDVIKTAVYNVKVIAPKKEISNELSKKLSKELSNDPSNDLEESMPNRNEESLEKNTGTNFTKSSNINSTANLLPKKVLKKPTSTDNVTLNNNTILNKMKKTTTFKESPENIKKFDEKDKIINMNIHEYLRENQMSIPNNPYKNIGSSATVNKSNTLKSKNTESGSGDSLYKKNQEFLKSERENLLNNRENNFDNDDNLTKVTIINNKSSKNNTPSQSPIKTVNFNSNYNIKISSYEEGLQKKNSAKNSAKSDQNNLENCENGENCENSHLLFKKDENLNNSTSTHEKIQNSENSQNSQISKTNTNSSNSSNSISQNFNPVNLNKQRRVSKLLLTLPWSKTIRRKTLKNFLTDPDEDRKYRSLPNIYDSLSGEEYKSEAEDDEDGYIIDENSLSKKTFNVIMMWCIIFSCTVEPFLIAFSIESEVMYFIETFVDSIFIADIIMNFWIPVQIGEKEIRIPKQIASHYLRTNFPFDFISSIPNAFWTFTGVKKLKALRVLKVGRISAVLAWFRLLKKSKKKQDDSGLERISNFLVLFLVLVHVSTCLWIYVGYSVQETEGISWLSMYSMYDENNFDIYICSLYYNLVTIYTIGYGDIHQTTLTEMMYDIFFMFVGVMMYSFVVSAMSQVFLNLSNFHKIFSEKLKILNEINEESPMSRDLYLGIKSSLRFSKQAAMEKFEFLETLPYTLKKEVLISMTRKGIRSLQFFRGQNRDFVIFVLPMLHTLKVKKNETLIAIGDFVEEMYIVRKGLLSIRLDEIYEHVEISQISEKSHFGELFMYLNENSQFLVTGRTSICDLFSITKSNFTKIKMAYNENILNVLSKSCIFLEKLEKLKNIVIEFFSYGMSIKKIKNFIKKVNFFSFKGQFDNLLKMDQLFHYEEVEDFILCNDLDDISNFLSTNMDEKDYLKCFYTKATGQFNNKLNSNGVVFYKGVAYQRKNAMYRHGRKTSLDLIRNYNYGLKYFQMFKNAEMNNEKQGENGNTETGNNQDVKRGGNTNTNNADNPHGYSSANQGTTVMIKNNREMARFSIFNFKGFKKGKLAETIRKAAEEKAKEKSSSNTESDPSENSNDNTNVGNNFLKLKTLTPYALPGIDLNNPGEVFLSQMASRISHMSAKKHIATLKTTKTKGILKKGTTNLIETVKDKPITANNKLSVPGITITPVISVTPSNPISELNAHVERIRRGSVNSRRGSFFKPSGESLLNPNKSIYNLSAYNTGNNIFGSKLHSKISLKKGMTKINEEVDEKAEKSTRKVSGEKDMIKDLKLALSPKKRKEDEKLRTTKSKDDSEEEKGNRSIIEVDIKNEKNKGKDSKKGNSNSSVINKEKNSDKEKEKQNSNKNTKNSPNIKFSVLNEEKETNPINNDSPIKAIKPSNTNSNNNINLIPVLNINDNPSTPIFAPRSNPNLLNIVKNRVENSNNININNNFKNISSSAYQEENTDTEINNIIKTINNPVNKNLNFNFSPVNAPAIPSAQEDKCKNYISTHENNINIVSINNNNAHVTTSPPQYNHFSQPPKVYNIYNYGNNYNHNFIITQKKEILKILRNDSFDIKSEKNPNSINSIENSINFKKNDSCTDREQKLEICRNFSVIITDNTFYLRTEDRENLNKNNFNNNFLEEINFVEISHPSPEITVPCAGNKNSENNKNFSNKNLNFLNAINYANNNNLNKNSKILNTTPIANKVMNSFRSGNNLNASSFREENNTPRYGLENNKKKNSNLNSENFSNFSNISNSTIKGEQNLNKLLDNQMKCDPNFIAVNFSHDDESVNTINTPNTNNNLGSFSNLNLNSYLRSKNTKEINEENFTGAYNAYTHAQLSQVILSKIHKDMVTEESSIDNIEQHISMLGQGKKNRNFNFHDDLDKTITDEDIKMVDEKSLDLSEYNLTEKGEVVENEKNKEKEVKKNINKENEKENEKGNVKDNRDNTKDNIEAAFPNEIPSETSNRLSLIKPSKTFNIMPNKLLNETPNETLNKTPTNPSNKFSFKTSNLTPTETPTIASNLTPNKTPNVTPTITLNLTPTITPTITPNLTPTIIPNFSPTKTPNLTPNSPSINSSSSPKTNLRTKRSVNSNIELITNRNDENSTNELDKFIIEASDNINKLNNKEKPSLISQASNASSSISNSKSNSESNNNTSSNNIPNNKPLQKPHVNYDFGKTMSQYIQEGQSENPKISRQPTLVARNSIVSDLSSGTKLTGNHKNSLREKIGLKSKSREAIFQEVTKGLYIDEMFQMNKHFLKEKINNVLMERREIKQLAQHSFRKLDNMLFFIKEVNRNYSK
jgi:hypothetical protein